LENIDIANSQVYTNEYKVYNRVHLPTKNSRVNCGAKKYVGENARTNLIETNMSLFKNIQKMYCRSYFKHNHKHGEEEEMFLIKQ
jgi:hypothetical protein